MKIITPPPSAISAPLLFASVDDLIEALPERAQAKMLKLREERDDAHAVGLPLSEERNELIRELWQLEADAKRLTLPRLHGGNELTEDSPQVKRARAQIAQKKKRRDALITRIEELGARWGQLSRLVQSLEGFLTAHAPEGFRQHEPIEPPTIRKGETLPAAIERSRRRIRELEADQKRAASAPFPASECKAIARRQVEALAARGAPNILPLVDHRGEIDFPREHTNAVVGGAKEVVGVVSFQLPDMLAFTAWLHRDALLARIDEEIGELVDDDQALSDQARAEKLAEIDSDQLAAEREEEALITQAGIDCLRRQDADPRAVLELV